ncbi:MAG: hypothetical protein N3E37_01740 [Candidatus Micrarchaeota archaeon]|nr:hypothetical protein [Candidatus Micrarchaeota archaeon]
MSTYSLPFVLSLLLFFVLSFSMSHFISWFISRRGKNSKIVGIDVHKPNKPTIPEMGGFAVIGGLLAGFMTLLFFDTFVHNIVDERVITAVVLVITIAGLIGIVDDIYVLPQWLKALLPMFISAPLVALMAVGETSITLPLLGTIDFGIVYVLVLIPLAITVCSNLTNMLAGFNGLETGLAMIIFFGLMFLGFVKGNVLLLVINGIAFFSSLAFFLYNRYPAKIFPGDTGTLVYGSVIASSVIVGNFESAGAMMMILYYVDFFIKVLNRFPKTFCVNINGRLYPENNSIRGLVDLILVKIGPMPEDKLVLLLLITQIIIVLSVITFYILPT